MQYCHTSDRDNLAAYGDCGMEGVDSALWKEVSELRMELNYWPQQAHLQCLSAVHPWGYEQMKK